MIIMKIRVNVKKATWAKLPFKDTLVVNKSSLFSLNSPLSPSQIAIYPLLMFFYSDNENERLSPQSIITINRDWFCVCLNFHFLITH